MRGLRDVGLRQAGAISGGLTPAAASFFSYGRQHGTWHTSNPQAGDAVVFDLNSSVPSPAMWVW